MRLRRLIPYFTQGIAVGIIFGLAVVLLLWLKPFTNNPTIEINEVKTRTTNSASDSRGSMPFSYADAVTTAAPSVVNIHTTKIIKRRINPLFDDPRIKRFFGDRITPPREQRQNSLGSGVIVSPQGYILTNNHVIDGADEILVALHDGRTAGAEVVGTDPETDIAVLRITLDKLQGITMMSDSESLRVGDVVLAIGNPFGVGQTVTQGIVSATGRKQLGLSTFENFIQTDAAINPGNSGGALINPYGELVGINTAIFSRSGGSQGIGFAIPTDLAKNVLTQLIERGHVVRSWLGIETQSITPALAESFGLLDIKGILVAGVMRNSPGALAGLKPGDIITHINENEINIASEAMQLVLESPPGTTISLELLRNGNNIKLEATLGNRPTPNPKS